MNAESASWDATGARLRRSSAWLRAVGGREWSSLDFVDTLELDVDAWLASGWIERLPMPNGDIEAIAPTAAAYASEVTADAAVTVLCLGMGATQGHLTFAIAAADCAALRLPTEPLGEEREPTIAVSGVALPPSAFDEAVSSEGWRSMRLSAVGVAMSSVLRRQTLFIDVDTGAGEAEAAIDVMARGLPLWRGPLRAWTDALARVGGGA